MFLFFFIGDKASDSNEKLAEYVKKYDFDLVKVVQTLLALRLKLAYISDVSTHYEIKPALYNSQLYVGAIEHERPKSFEEGESLIEALKLDLYFSKQNEIALSLHKKAFKCIEDTFMPNTDDSCLFFHHKGKVLREKETLDAIRWSKRPYMAYSQKKDAKSFDKYENCINYHLTVALNKLITELLNVDIAFNPIEFKANYIVSNFIESNEQYSNPLIIIDTFSSYKTDKERIEFRDYLKQTFGTKSVIDVEDAPKPEQLETENVSYLVINEEKKKNGSSIVRTDTEEPFNSFFQALAEYSKDANIPFDYYTLVKIHRFLNELPSVTQGVDIGKITKQQIQKDKEGDILKDDNGNILPAKTVLNELNKNLVQKIKTELWLKERVFHYRSIEGINLPNAELTLFFIRKLENNQTYVSVVDVTTNHQGIKINKQQRYETKDESRFKFDYEYLEKAFPIKSFNFATIYNGSFYLYDKINQKLLVSYNSPAIPCLIGNAAFDNVERNKLAKGINREGALPKNCVLPYYINRCFKPKQLYYIFLEECGQESVRYFVSNAEPAKAKIDKQRLMKNLLVFNQDGHKTPPLEEEITTLFLQSFTFNFLNNHEASKKSIFQKMAELYIEN